MITISTPNGTATDSEGAVLRFENEMGALIWRKLEKIISFALIDESFSPSVERNYMRIAFHH